MKRHHTRPPNFTPDEALADLGTHQNSRPKPRQRTRRKQR